MRPSALTLVQRRRRHRLRGDGGSTRPSVDPTEGPLPDATSAIRGSTAHETLAARGAYVMVHPASPPDEDVLDLPAIPQWTPWALAEWSTRVDVGGLQRNRKGPSLVGAATGEPGGSDDDERGHDDPRAVPRRPGAIGSP